MVNMQEVSPLTGKHYKLNTKVPTKCTCQPLTLSFDTVVTVTIYHQVLCQKGESISLQIHVLFMSKVKLTIYIRTLSERTYVKVYLCLKFGLSNGSYQKLMCSRISKTK